MWCRLSTIWRRGPPPAPWVSGARARVARGAALPWREAARPVPPAVFVPYPFHRDRQQELNAQVLRGRGAAVIVADDERLGENLAATLRELIADPARLMRMAAQARTAAKPDAARTI